MIFVSFGNSPVPFIRMAEAVDKYASESGEKIIVQSGQTKYHFKHCEVVPFMDKNVFRSHLESCEIAILQGGWWRSRAFRSWELQLRSQSACRWGSYREHGRGAC